jgi:hypothetical protein
MRRSTAFRRADKMAKTREFKGGAKLNAAVVETLADAGVGQRLAELGQEIPAREQQSPKALLAHHKAEIEKWWPVIRPPTSRASDLRGHRGAAQQPQVVTRRGTGL